MHQYGVEPVHGEFVILAKGSDLLPVFWTDDFWKIPVLAAPRYHAVYASDLLLDEVMSGAARYA